MDEQPDEAATPAAEHADADSEPDGMAAIDIEALAEKVYRLMLAEIRLDRTRGLAPDDGG